MILSAILTMACLFAPQQSLKEEATVHGYRLFARCWRTPTGTEPYMIWTIGSLDGQPEGNRWRINGESITFEGLPIEPSSGFRKTLVATDPEAVAGPMLQQTGGEKAQFAIIRGHLEKVATLVEDLPLPDATLAKAARQPGGDLGTMYHLVIPHPMKLTTPSGLTIDIPAQGAETKINYAATTFQPMAAIVFRTSFKESEDRIPKSDLFKKFGGPIDIDATLLGVGESYAAGMVDKDYVVEVKGFSIKPGPATKLSIRITQTAILESYPLSFRVKVRDSK